MASGSSPTAPAPNQPSSNGSSPLVPSKALPLPSSSPSPSTSGFAYPFAAAPDIIRSNQKDAYYQGVLFEQLSTILRKIYGEPLESEPPFVPSLLDRAMLTCFQPTGARVLHKYSLEAKTFADLVYLSLTTLRNARTLGEEYCDILHVESATSKLPALRRRLGFILTTILIPYFVTKSLPRLRSRLRQKLQSSLRASQSSSEDLKHPTSTSYMTRTKSYLLENLDTLTSSESLLALHLGLFYFTGAYYHLSKRIWGLRYIFTKRLLPHEQRAGYEVLGLLLMAQLATQGYFHLSSTFSHSSAATPEEENANNILSKSHPGVPPSNNPDATAHGDGPRYNLDDEKVMRFISGESGRKCTLCLENMKDPTATGCGHVFCWSCIGEWCRSKVSSPLSFPPPNPNLTYEKPADAPPPPLSPNARYADNQP